MGNSRLSEPSKSLTSNAKAYQLYLQGRHLWRQRSAVSLKEAVKLFREAVAIDPDFHRAWSNLAVAYVNLPSYDFSYPMQEAYDEALIAAEKALSISPQSAEALLIKANQHHIDCNYATAARLYETAIELDPNDPTAHHWYAILLNNAGHTSRAYEHIQIAKEIDPLIAAIHGIEAEIYKALGDYVNAEKSTRAKIGRAHV